MAGDGVGSREGGKMADMDEGKGIRNRHRAKRRDGQERAETEERR